MKCADCNGTGRITLFSSVVDCDCKKRSIADLVNVTITFDSEMSKVERQMVERELAGAIVPGSVRVVEHGVSATIPHSSVDDTRSGQGRSYLSELEKYSDRIADGLAKDSGLPRDILFGEAPRDMLSQSGLMSYPVPRGILYADAPRGLNDVAVPWFEHVKDNVARFADAPLVRRKAKVDADYSITVGDETITFASEHDLDPLSVSFYERMIGRLCRAGQPAASVHTCLVGASDSDPPEGADSSRNASTVAARDAAVFVRALRDNDANGVIVCETEAEVGRATEAMAALGWMPSASTSGRWFSHDGFARVAHVATSAKAHSLAVGAAWIVGDAQTLPDVRKALVFAPGLVLCDGGTICQMPDRCPTRALDISLLTFAIGSSASVFND